MGLPTSIGNNIPPGPFIIVKDISTIGPYHMVYYAHLQEVSEGADWRTLDNIQCIKAGITWLFTNLGGKFRLGTFPWKLLPSELAHHHYVMKDKTFPIVFANTRIKKPKSLICKEAASHHHSSPILIDETSSPPQIIPHKQKLVLVIELHHHPPHPLNIIKGPSRKQKSTPAGCKVIPIDMSSDTQAKLDAKNEFKNPLRAEDSNITGEKTSRDAPKEKKTKKKVCYVSVTDEPDSKEEKISVPGQEPLCLHNCPEDSLQPHTQHGILKPKKIIPGLSEAAHQMMMYSEGKCPLQALVGSNTFQKASQEGLQASQDTPQGGCNASQEVLQGGHDTS
ncbi:hypothetical protein EDB19DRAFT_1823478 [Suillus lakei]|nr:hypothetical protein EDB19DRAFT_1823478 [Suillus lakei]